MPSAPHDVSQLDGSSLKTSKARRLSFGGGGIF
jgi:hypothetical protein